MHNRGKDSEHDNEGAGEVDKGLDPEESSDAPTPNADATQMGEGVAEEDPSFPQLDTSLTVLQVRDAQKGSEEAWEELYHRFGPWIKHRIGRKQLPPGVEPDDVVQEVLFYVAQNLGRFEERPDGTFRHWLGKIIANKVNDLWRKPLAQKRGAGGEKVFRDCFSTTMSDINVPDRHARQSTILRFRELEERRTDAMEKLTPRHREVILLRDQDLSFEQIATRFGFKNAGTARALHHRAMENLRSLLEDLKP